MIGREQDALTASPSTVSNSGPPGRAPALPADSKLGGHGDATDAGEKRSLRQPEVLRGGYKATPWDTLTCPLPRSRQNAVAWESISAGT